MKYIPGKLGQLDTMQIKVGVTNPCDGYPVFIEYSHRKDLSNHAWFVCACDATKYANYMNSEENPNV